MVYKHLMGSKQPEHLGIVICDILKLVGAIVVKI